jgi:hypothetical protein
MSGSFLYWKPDTECIELYAINNELNAYIVIRKGDPSEEVITTNYMTIAYRLSLYMGDNKTV